jgi:hypothetical protein
MLTMMVGCGKKTTISNISPITNTITTTLPVPKTLFKEAQNTLKNVSSITYNENLLLSYEQNDLTYNNNIFYETNLSNTKGLMKIYGNKNTNNNTVYIVKEANHYVVYPEDQVGNNHVKYELNSDFVLGVGNNKVLNYLMNNESDYVKISGKDYTTYKRTFNLSTSDYKTMFDDILYHYVIGPLDEELYNVEISEEIVIDNHDQTFKMINFDLTQLINTLNLDFEATHFKYQIDLSNYNDDNVYFPYQDEFTLDDAPDTFKNYIFYFSNRINDFYKELDDGIMNSGHLDFENDVDIYSFVIPVQALVNVEVNSDVPFTYLVTNEMNDNSVDSPIKTDLNYVKEFEPGRYYIAIKSSHVGNYDLNISIKDKFSSVIKLNIEQGIEMIEINNTNIDPNELEYNGDMDVYALSDNNYEIKNPKIENVNLIVVKQYEDHLEYELLNSDTIQINENNQVNQYLVVYASNYTGEYNLEFIKK